ncbi:hypothetical protein [Bacteroides sp. 2201st1_D9_2201SCRN_220225]|uniref:hypothetical protein n=1 Tax=Bacteroides sp. 2201st1_D9_2201SCRN_220225 TaxID=3143218 RepID=UPI0034A383A4
MMEKGEFSVLYQSYRELRETVAVNGFYSLVAGLIIATFVFKLFDMANDMAKEEKGFSAKHFFELGREYILCSAMIAVLPLFLGWLEAIFAAGADKVVESIGGKYSSDNIWKAAILGDLENMVEGGSWNVVGTVFTHMLTSQVGTLFALAYDYITTLFLAARYAMLLLLEIVSPVAIACLYNKDLRSSFFVWVKNLFGCYMLYPAFVTVSVFSDLIVKNYIQQDSWPIWIMLFFSIILKTSLLATAKATVNKWL